MVLTQKHMSRRTMLRGTGAAITLPLLESMVPAGTAFAKTSAARAAGKVRLVCIEQVHGAAGCSPFGKEHFLWNPEKTGKAFELTVRPFARTKSMKASGSSMCPKSGNLRLSAWTGEHSPCRDSRNQGPATGSRAAIAGTASTALSRATQRARMLGRVGGAVRT